MLIVYPVVEPSRYAADLAEAGRAWRSHGFWRLIIFNLRAALAGTHRHAARL